MKFTREVLEMYALENILESGSEEAFKNMNHWIEGALWMQDQQEKSKIELCPKCKAPNYIENDFFYCVNPDCDYNK